MSDASSEDRRRVRIPGWRHRAVLVQIKTARGHNGHSAAIAILDQIGDPGPVAAACGDGRPALFPVKYGLAAKQVGLAGDNQHNSDDRGHSGSYSDDGGDAGIVFIANDY